MTVQSLSVDGAGGIVLGGPVAQNMYGTLTLRRGLVDTVDETFLWSMYNTALKQIWQAGIVPVWVQLC